MIARMKIERDFVRVTAGWRDYGSTYSAVVLQAVVLGVTEFAVGRVLHPAYYAFGLIMVLLVAIQDTRVAIASRCATLLDFVEKQPNQPPHRNAGSRPSPGDSSASETPSSPGPRG